MPTATEAPASRLWPRCRVVSSRLGAVKGDRVRRALLWTAFALFCAACVGAVVLVLWFMLFIGEGLGDFSNSPGTRGRP